ncbi:DNA-binding IclR family transcriptional regulator [Virgibacillus halotolerans]|uniref:IclR family transcriptional regulator n=1 Tax=Virgibacillus halotolerans TaxID=1071053 RepID=UPI0019613A69|nr:IclR family transcriptional regulator [Virgibacillus halotolerans]MBM7599209.1 DNA-binding IclR family transcriptional regulator [Virgibacillus halotolerans]
MVKKKSEPQTLSSVTNALRILKSFSTFEPTKRVTELSDQLGLAKSTISRLLATLAKEGFVIKDTETNGYQLGISVLTLGGIVTNNLEIHKEAAPVLNNLVSDTGETAHLAIIDRLDTVYIHKEECNHPVRILTHLGRRNPSYCTSSGKVLLAYNDNNIVEDVIRNGLVSHTPNSITDPDVLRNELKTIRKKGYSVSIEELTEGTKSVAAPIRDYTGKVVSAITVVGPIQRMKSSKIPEIAKKVMAAGIEASERLGYDERYFKRFN